MRRNVFMVLLLLMISVLLYASAGDKDTASFTIKAFKTGGMPLKLVINSRIDLSDVLETSAAGAAGGEIVLNGVIDDILGSDAGLQAAGLSAYIVFSYRLEGNISGMYDISFDFTPLTHTNGTDTIGTTYQIGNFNTVFIGTTGESQSSTYGDWMISQTPESVQTASPGADTLPEFTETVEVRRIDGTAVTEGTSTPQWAARGAVGMIVDSASYSSADTPYGDYRTTVTVSVKTHT